MRWPPSSSVRTNAFLFIAATVVALVAAELFARLLGVAPRFGQFIFVRGVTSRVVDGVPLWSDAHPRCDPGDLRRAADATDAFTIVGLGDSIMYGVGLAKEDTYLEEAGRRLGRGSDGPVETCNLAVPGYNTMQESAVYEELENQRVRPDLLLVHYWSDDMHQYRMVGGYVVDLGNVSESNGRLVVRALPVPAPLADFLLVHSRLYDLLTQVVIALRRHPDAGDDWERVTTPLDAIRRRAERDGTHVVVLVSPLLTGSTPETNPDVARLREYAAGSGVEVIDLATWVAGTDCKEIALDAYHFNGKGHQIIGERLADYVRQHRFAARNGGSAASGSP